jgi:hypothetical protein
MYPLAPTEGWGEGQGEGMSANGANALDVVFAMTSQQEHRG